MTWEIELDAETPLAAAEEALEIMRDEGSLALCFTVCRRGQRYLVNLKADDGSTTVWNLRTRRKTVHPR